MIKSSDLKKQAEELHAAGKMPSLEDVLQAVASIRGKYRDQILEARKTKFNIDAGADALGDSSI
jgi:hypothetical protein